MKLATMFNFHIWRWDFDLPADPEAFYVVDGVSFPVAANPLGKVRVAYVSCNGQELNDAERVPDERNLMWRRLADEQRAGPFHLMLHGGDQLYADEVLHCHPAVTAWAEADLEDKNSHQFTEEMKTAAEHFLFDRYCAQYRVPEMAFLLARIPSLMMWDDHDIIDGWGSHPLAMLKSDVGQGLFDVARRLFMLFQLASTSRSPASPIVDPASASLTCALQFPAFAVMAPDLRSERRPDRVLGASGWAALESIFQRHPGGQQWLVMSSVPLLGPRLSWVEAFIGIVPKLKRYEDDLRDQWQSRAHREEWRRFLRFLEDRIFLQGGHATILSGEIHLATQADMPMKGSATMHQLVASGIAHPPPPALYGRCLGWLAALGEAPLKGQPIRLKPLPGQQQIYVSERNYLVLECDQQSWSASWELEFSGRTKKILLDRQPSN